MWCIFWKRPHSLSAVPSHSTRGPLSQVACLKKCSKLLKLCSSPKTWAVLYFLIFYCSIFIVAVEWKRGKSTGTDSSGSRHPQSCGTANVVHRFIQGRWKEATVVKPSQALFYVNLRLSEVIKQRSECDSQTGVTRSSDAGFWWRHERRRCEVGRVRTSVHHLQACGTYESEPMTAMTCLCSSHCFSPKTSFHFLLHDCLVQCENKRAASQWTGIPFSKEGSPRLETHLKALLSLQLTVSWICWLETMLRLKGGRWPLWEKLLSGLRLRAGTLSVEVLYSPVSALFARQCGFLQAKYALCFTGKRQVWLVWCVCVFSVQSRPVASCGKTAIIPAVDLELQLYPSQQELPAATLMNTWQFLLPPPLKDHLLVSRPSEKPHRPRAFSAGSLIVIPTANLSLLPFAAALGANLCNFSGDVMISWRELRPPLGRPDLLVLSFLWQVTMV